jgi:hypothetical protein
MSDWNAKSRRKLVAITLISFVAQACVLGSVGEPRSRIETSADGLRTFTYFHERDGHPVACGAYALADPVHGTFEGEVRAREPVWIKTDDGRQLSVVWPSGFAVRFEPNPVLYNELGKPVAWAGEPTELSHTEWDEASGTFDDPYIAHGAAYKGCYPYLT